MVVPHAFAVATARPSAIAHPLRQDPFTGLAAGAARERPGRNAGIELRAAAVARRPAHLSLGAELRLDNEAVGHGHPLRLRVARNDERAGPPRECGAA